MYCIVRPNMATSLLQDGFHYIEDPGVRQMNSELDEVQRKLATLLQMHPQQNIDTLRLNFATFIR